ncbi:MAG: hypothetical protein ABIH34_01495 [Nanoarchaeota archaeon]
MYQQYQQLWSYLTDQYQEHKGAIKRQAIPVVLALAGIITLFSQSYWFKEHIVPPPEHIQMTRAEKERDYLNGFLRYHSITQQSPETRNLDPVLEEELLRTLKSTVTSLDQLADSLEATEVVKTYLAEKEQSVKSANLSIPAGWGLVFLGFLPSLYRIIFSRKEESEGEPQKKTVEASS